MFFLARVKKKLIVILADWLYCHRTMSNSSVQEAKLLLPASLSAVLLR